MRYLRWSVATVVAAVLCLSPFSLGVAQSGGRGPAPPAMPPMAGMPDDPMGMAVHAMEGMHDSIAMLHMQMSPLRRATAADTARAWAVVKELRSAIAKYADTTAAVKDGFEMFAPNMKNQKVYHFTKKMNGLEEAFRWDPAKPTSLLYDKQANGTFKLVGAMYTMPRIAPVSRLDERVPTSIAQWHQHVNWCIPKAGQQARWTELQGGHPVFGPESPIVTKAACDRVGGNFQDTIFGWMVHANVFAGEDLGTIFADHDHGG